MHRTPFYHPLCNENECPSEPHHRTHNEIYGSSRHSTGPQPMPHTHSPLHSQITIQPAHFFLTRKYSRAPARKRAPPPKKGTRYPTLKDSIGLNPHPETLRDYRSKPTIMQLATSELHTHVMSNENKLPLKIHHCICVPVLALAHRHTSGKRRAHAGSHQAPLTRNG